MPRTTAHLSAKSGVVSWMTGTGTDSSHGDPAVVRRSGELLRLSLNPVGRGDGDELHQLVYDEDDEFLQMAREGEVSPTLLRSVVRSHALPHQRVSIELVGSTAFALVFRLLGGARGGAKSVTLHHPPCDHSALAGSGPSPVAAAIT